jgi:hypothetical protein
MKLLRRGRQNRIITGWSQEKGGRWLLAKNKKKPVKEEDLNRQKGS